MEKKLHSSTSNQYWPQTGHTMHWNSPAPLSYFFDTFWRNANEIRQAKVTDYLLNKDLEIPLENSQLIRGGAEEYSMCVLVPPITPHLTPVTTHKSSSVQNKILLWWWIRLSYPKHHNLKKIFFLNSWVMTYEAITFEQTLPSGLYIAWSKEWIPYSVTKFLWTRTMERVIEDRKLLHGE